jgi:1-aminocyclopropane-1-carboxylate deaminase/D-cysteine desulfhydrase-like pyridoxal-dependent ACC family enzyme
MERLTDALGGPRVLVKRDDCTGLALGGNKARKLEHLCAEALAAGCDTLVTGGGPQSNHVRMTTAAANRLGLGCHVALAGAATARPSGNLLLDQVLGAQLHFVGPVEYYELEAAIGEVVTLVADQGHRPFAIPIGGASVTGVVAYADAADELYDQLGADAVDVIVVADGSGGTHAGLLAGVAGRARIVGVDVGTRPDLDEVVPRLASEAAARTGRPPDRKSVV